MTIPQLNTIRDVAYQALRDEINLAKSALIAKGSGERARLLGSALKKFDFASDELVYATAIEALSVIPEHRLLVKQRALKNKLKPRRKT